MYRKLTELNLEIWSFYTTFIFFSFLYNAFWWQQASLETKSYVYIRSIWRYVPLPSPQGRRECRSRGGTGATGPDRTRPTGASSRLASWSRCSGRPRSTSTMPWRLKRFTSSLTQALSWVSSCVSRKTQLPCRAMDVWRSVRSFIDGSWRGLILFFSRSRITYTVLGVECFESLWSNCFS